MLLSKISYPVRKHKWKIALGAVLGIVSNYAMDTYILHQYRAGIYEKAALRSISAITHEDDLRNTIKVIVDKSSYNGKAKGAYVDEIMPLLNLAGFHVDLLEYDPEFTPLVALAESTSTANLHAIVICGDDTSFHQFITGYLNKEKTERVPIALVPLGLAKYDSFYNSLFHLEQDATKRIINATARVIDGKPRKIDLSLAMHSPINSESPELRKIPILSHLCAGLSAEYLLQNKSKYSSSSDLGARIRIFFNMCKKRPSNAALLNLSEFSYLQSAYEGDHKVTLLIRPKIGEEKFTYQQSFSFTNIFDSFFSVKELSISSRPMESVGPVFQVYNNHDRIFPAFNAWLVYRKLKGLAGFFKSPILSLGTVTQFESLDITFSENTAVVIDGQHYPFAQFSIVQEREAVEIIV